MSAGPGGDGDGGDHDDDLEAFRARIRAWLEHRCPASMREPVRTQADEVWGGRRPVFAHPDARLWLEIMAAHGYIAPTWPSEYGGAGLSADQARVLGEEMRALGCRDPLKSLGLWLLAPVLLAHGTEAQKREHLSQIARGKIRWCQGYSEPGAGSDLASLETRAERDGDHYIVNGQKVWTSHADKADYMFCLVRTSTGTSKHEGISFLLIDMASPGVSVRPIKLISGASPFCETFFDNVRVPVHNRVGEEGQGWTIAKELLAHERTFMSSARAAKHEETTSLVDLARRYVGMGEDRQLADPVLRDAIAAVEIDTLAYRLTVQQSVERARQGRPPGPESSILKLYGTELNKRGKALRVEIAGFRGVLWPHRDDGDGEHAGAAQSGQDSGHAGPADHTIDDLERALPREWLRSRAGSIEGGTSEIQLNIIAKRVLGLPD